MDDNEVPRMDDRPGGQSDGGRASPVSKEVRQESTINPESLKKAPSIRPGKAPSIRKKKAPSNYSPREVLGVCTTDELEQLLEEQGQGEWAGLRAKGLMMLINLFCRHPDGMECSADLARQYVSPFKRRKSPQTIAEPLILLRKIGILTKPRKYRCDYIRHSNFYLLGSHWRDRIQPRKVYLTPNLVRKLEQADFRKQLRLSKRYPFLSQLRKDLARVSLADRARSEIVRLRRANQGGGGLLSIIDSIDTRNHQVKVNSVGTIYTPLSSLPRELKSLLLLDGASAVFADISCAHWCLLPCLASGRINWLRSDQPMSDTGELELERARFIEFVSSGDFYGRWCNDPDDQKERASVKNSLNCALNMKTEMSLRVESYRALKREYPRMIGIVEDLKRDDHRTLAQLLQRSMSDLVKSALLKLQNEGVPVIPDSDALLCRMEDLQRVSYVLGEMLYHVSGGVCCNVAGQRFQPSDDLDPWAAITGLGSERLDIT